MGLPGSMVSELVWLYFFYGDHAYLCAAARDPRSQELMNRMQRDSSTLAVLLKQRGRSCTPWKTPRSQHWK